LSMHVRQLLLRAFVCRQEYPRQLRVVVQAWSYRRLRSNIVHENFRQSRKPR
jgi:hypothetical protein